MPERTKRRLTAVLVADLVGFSHLVEVDEEGTLRNLRTLRNEVIDPSIDVFGGRVANTAGDSLLLEFPSVVDAVRCWSSMLNDIANRNQELAQDQRILFRAGINIGGCRC